MKRTAIFAQALESACRHVQPRGRERFCAHGLAVADGRYLVRHCKADWKCPVIMHAEEVNEAAETAKGALYERDAQTRTIAV
jgi:hypothetical protein